MRILQVYPEIMKGDAISSIVMALHRINEDAGHSDSIMAHSSELQGVMLAAGAPQRYSKSQLAKKFLASPQKRRLLHAYLAQRKAAKGQPFADPKAACAQVDMRIWHLGITYSLMEENIRPHDVVFFYGLNYPYLSSSPEAIIGTYGTLLWLRAMQPYMIVESESVRRELLRLGYSGSEITILPLFHPYALPYTEHQADKPRLLAYGRYAMNKRIPEIASKCSQAHIQFTAFGDNSKYHEFVKEFERASRYRSDGIRLYGKAADREPYYNDANIYICNSENEGFNMGVVESMAHSLPILVRRGTAAEELVRNGEDGYLFSDIDEISELADAIMRDYSRFGRNAWERSQEFTLGKFKDRYLSILDRYKEERGIKE